MMEEAPTTLEITVTYTDGTIETYEVWGWTIGERFLVISYGEPVMRSWINMDSIVSMTALAPPPELISDEEE